MSSPLHPEAIQRLQRAERRWLDDARSRLSQPRPQTPDSEAEEDSDD